MVVRMLADVRQAAIRPVIEGNVARGALVQTDEHDVYARPEEWGHGHGTACHARGEHARDGDGDGFREVHVDATEGVRSLLRSWPRPHRGVPREKPPAYLGFFQVVHNARSRGKALLGTLIAGLVARPQCSPPRIPTRDAERIPRTAPAWKWDRLAGRTVPADGATGGRAGAGFGWVATDPG